MYPQQPGMAIPAAAMWPQSSQFSPFYGFQGMPNFFGQGVAGSLSQMGMQSFLGNAFSQMQMMPMGLHDQNLLDRIRHQDLTRRHYRVIQEMAEKDRESYLRLGRGIFTSFGVPFGHEQALAANTMASAAIAASPVAVPIFADFMDAAAGARGSAAVMAHYMHMGGRQRLDPITGRMGITDSNLKTTMDQVWQDMFAGQKYLAQPFSAGQAGRLFQELQVRGMMPGASTREMVEQAGGVGSATEYIQLDAKRISSTLQGWGKAVQAMKEIFDATGRPDAPMPALINALQELTRGATSQLDPQRIASLVRDTFSLSKNSGISLDATGLLVQRAAANAVQSGLDPMFGLLATHHNRAFTSAYQGLGAGAYQAWGRGDLLRHQEQNERLFLGAANSQAATQFATARHISNMLQTGSNQWGFAAGTDASKYMQNLVTGAGEAKIFRSDAEFASMIAAGTNGTVSQAEVLRHMQNNQMVQETLAKDPGLISRVRARQGEEAKTVIGAAAASSLQGSLAGLLPDRAALEALAPKLGESFAESFMAASNATVTDNKARNKRLATNLYDRLTQLSADGDAGAAKILAGLPADPAQREQALTSMVDIAYGRADRDVRGAMNGMSIQDAFVNFNTTLMKGLQRSHAAARVDSAQRDALDKLGKTSWARSLAESLMTLDPADKQPFSKLLAEAAGGVLSGDVLRALEQSPELTKMRDAAAAWQAARGQLDSATTDEERAKALSAVDAQAITFQQQTERFAKAMHAQGYLSADQVDRKKLRSAMEAVGRIEFDLAEFRTMHPDDPRYAAKKSQILRGIKIHGGQVSSFLQEFLQDKTSLGRYGAGLTTLGEELGSLEGERNEIIARGAAAGMSAAQVAASDPRIREIHSRQTAVMQQMRGMIDDPKSRYAYISDRDGLQAIADRLSKTDAIATSELSSLLMMDETEWRGLGLSDAEVKNLSVAKQQYEQALKSGEGADAKYLRQYEAQAKSALDVLAGGSVDAESDEVRKILEMTRGSGTAAAAARQELARLAKSRRGYDKLRESVPHGEGSIKARREEEAEYLKDLGDLASSHGGDEDSVKSVRERLERRAQEQEVALQEEKTQEAESGGQATSFAIGSLYIVDERGSGRLDLKNEAAP